MESRELRRARDEGHERMSETSSAARTEMAILPLREFCRLFKMNLRHCRRRIKAGKMPDVELIAGRWYVYVPTRAVEAARK